MTTKSSFTLLGILLFLVVNIGIAFGQQTEASNTTATKTVTNIIQLQPTPVEPKGSGIIKTGITTNTDGTTLQQAFIVIATNLEGGGTYTLVIDGVITDTEVASTTTNSFLEFIYSSTTKIGSPSNSVKRMPKAMRPIGNIKHIEIRNAQGQTVLTGDFQ